MLTSPRLHSRMRFLHGLFILVLAAPVFANTVDNGPFSAKYPSYHATYGCGSCHTAAPALHSYGQSYKAAVEARGGRVTANVAPALTDIETLDSDGDGYSNSVEINSNTQAGNAASHPSAGATLATDTPARTGPPSRTLS